MNYFRVTRPLSKLERMPLKRVLLFPFALCVCLLPVIQSAAVRAQSIAPAGDGTGTSVLQNGDAYTIQGGQLSGDRTNLFHSFERFGLNAAESATFLASPVLRNILGRVVGSDPSIINGLLQVTGGHANLYLINPSGIVFGSHARLDVPASFTGTTANGVGFENGQWFNVIGSNNYAALIGAPSAFTFTTAQPGAIANLGNLAVSQGQSLTLLGGTVLNNGQLTAPGGQITIAAVPGQNLVRLSQQNHLLSLEFSPLRSPAISGPTPATLPQLLTGGNLGNATGVTVHQNGTVQLNGSSVHSPVTGATIVGGQVSVTSPEIPNSPAQIAVLGDRVTLSGATLDASGTNGGMVRVGGDYQGRGTVPNARFTDVDANTVLRADAIVPSNGTGAIGNGGTVIIWSDNVTNFAGRVTAQGGSSGGNGGLVETSGRQTLNVAPTARVNASAPQGQGGTWLLDPADLTVVGTGGTADVTGGPPNFTNTPVEASTINAATIEANLTGNYTVNLQATNSITVNAPINDTGEPGNLVLSTPTVNLNEPITLGGSLSGTATTVNVGSNGRVQNGVDVVAEGGTVNLAAATYTLASTVNILKPLTLNGVTAASTSVSGNNAVQVFNISGSGTTVTLNRLTIENGNGFQSGGISHTDGTLTINNSILTGNTGTNSGGIRTTSRLIINNSTITGNSAFGGGGIRNSNGNVTVSNSTISNNIADGPGGGIANNGILELINNSTISGNSSGNFGGGIDNTGTLTVTNSSISNNTSSFVGGGINNDASVTVTNSTISGNSASSVGGGINNNANATVANSAINGNTASSVGGGINNNANATVANSAINGNTATFGGGISNNNSGAGLTVTDSVINGNTVTFRGGGIDNNNGGNAIVTSSTISGNIAGSGGGISNNSGGSATVTNSAISGNTAISGGGIYSDSGNATVANSTISGNNAGNNGGGIFYIGGSLTVNNSTISGNNAGNNGGGISINDSFFNIRNSIVAGNASSTGADVSGNVNSQGNNLIGNANGSSGYIDTDLLNIDPRLAPLGNYGGSTQTMALLPGSPAINAAGESGATIADQRGVAAVGIRDVGAFESRGFVLTPQPGSTPQSIAVSTTFQFSLGVTVSSPFNEPVVGGVVSFTAPIAGASALLSAPSAIVGSNGQASVIATANATPGDYVVTVRVGGAPDATFALRNTVPENPAPNAEVVPPENPAPDARVVQQENTPTRPNPPIAIVPPVSVADTIFQSVEDSITSQFVTHLELSETPKPKSLTETQDALRQIASASGVQPSILYVLLIPRPDDYQFSRGENTKPEVFHDLATGQLMIRQVPEAASDLKLFLVTPSGNPILKSVPGVTRAAILETAREFRAEIADPSKIRTRSYLRSSQKLYQWLIAPISDELKAQGIGTISFIMDTPLRFLPLAALHDGKQFLVEQYSVGLMPSLSLTNDRYGDVRASKILGAGASTFTDPTQNPLPAVQEEIATILSTNNQQRAGELLNSEFTSNNLINARRNQPFGIVHLATHGEFLPGNIDQSYIQLANEKLRLDQLRSLGWNDPPAELVVLSACRMAIGNETAELGFAGFAVKAGAKSALASLWNVSDEGTMGLMAEFYQQLWQAPLKAEALRRAQIALLRNQVSLRQGQLIWSGTPITLPSELAKLGTKELSHPYFWSAFTMVGSPW